jgi:hypothetical protein
VDSVSPHPTKIKNKAKNNNKNQTVTGARSSPNSELVSGIKKKIKLQQTLNVWVNHV